jgi:hypothetical protein
MRRAGGTLASDGYGGSSSAADLVHPHWCHMPGPNTGWRGGSQSRRRSDPEVGQLPASSSPARQPRHWRRPPPRDPAPDGTPAPGPGRRPGPSLPPLTPIPDLLTHPPHARAEDPALTETLVPHDCPDLPQQPDLPREPAVPGCATHSRTLPGANPASPYPAAAAPPARRADPSSAADPLVPRAAGPPPNPNPRAEIRGGDRAGTGRGPGTASGEGAGTRATSGTSGSVTGLRFNRVSTPAVIDNVDEHLRRVGNGGIEGASWHS